MAGWLRHPTKWLVAEHVDEPAIWQPQTLAARISVVILYLAPGLLAYALLRFARQPLQRGLGLTSAEAQIGVIMTGVMLLMGASTLVCARALDGLCPRDALRVIGFNRFDRVGILVAVVIWLAVVATSSLLPYEEDLRDLVESVDWLALPSWHFQRTDGFRQLPLVLGGFALVANVVCEEVWFRAYLQDKLRFLGRPSWVVAGLLFSLYHVFEAPVAYPGVLGALALSGLWALRHDLWACMTLHLLLNAPV